MLLAAASPVRTIRACDSPSGCEPPVPAGALFSPAPSPCHPHLVCCLAPLKCFLWQILTEMGLWPAKRTLSMVLYSIYRAVTTSQARHTSSCFAPTPGLQGRCYPHTTHAETEAQTGGATCPRSHAQKGLEPGLSTGVAAGTASPFLCPPCGPVLTVGDPDPRGDTSQLQKAAPGEQCHLKGLSTPSRRHR